MGSTKPTEGREREIKLAVPADRAEAVRQALHARRGGAPRRLLARYYDTADRKLARAHAALRLRDEGDGWIQTFKAAGSDPLTRIEHACARPDASLDLRAFERMAGAGVLRKLGSEPGTPSARRLDIRFETDFMRLTRRLRRGDTQIEIAFDVGEIRAGGRSAPVCELEFECLSGDPAQMLRAAREWAIRFGLWIDPLSKAERGDSLADGAAGRVPRAIRRPRCRPGDPAGRVWWAIVDECCEQLLASAASIAFDEPDAEHVHMLRVALRRLRAVSDAGRGGLPVPPARVREALGALGRQLGAARDRDVFEQRFRKTLSEAGCPPFEFGIEPSGSWGHLLRDPTAQQVLFDLLGWRYGTAASRFVRDPAPALRQAVDSRWRRLWHGAASFESLDDSRRHRLRRRIRRLRYLLELSEPLLEGARRQAAWLVRAQDALGQWADQRMAVGLLAHVPEATPGVWFARGWFAHQGPSIDAECAKGLARLARRVRRQR